MGWRGRRGLRRDEGGQLLLLAGVILVLSFIVTALTLSQVADLERRVVAEQRALLLDEFRFLRVEVNSTLGDTTSSTTDNNTFKSTFERMETALTGVENGRGYDLLVSLGGAGEATTATELDDFTKAGGTLYEGVSFDGQRDFTDVAYDGVNDGILWYDGNIQGVVVYIYLSDQTTTVEEVLLCAVNL